MSFVSRWTQSISRAGRDGLSLSRAVYGAVLPGKRSHPTSLSMAANASFGERIKSVLLQEARKQPVPNALAISVLKIDKEIGLVKYWGLAEYLRQNQPLFSFASFSSRFMTKKAESIVNNDGNGDTVVNSTTSTSETPSSFGSTAKVAFMITSSMKRDLVDGLGYEGSVVKGMTPQQASLVIHHRLAPESYEEQIPKLEKNFEEEQTKLRKEQRKEQEKLEGLESESQTSPKTPSTDIQDSIGDSSGSSTTSGQLSTSTEDSKSESPLLLSSSSSNDSEESPSPSPSPSTPLQPLLDESEGGVDLWYEVVEIQEDDTKTNEIRHGLYKDRDEGVLGLEARRDIHNKRQQEAQAIKNNRNEERTIDALKVSFVLRPISGKDVL